MKTNETMTLLNKSSGRLETFNIHTGELVVSDGELVSKLLYTTELSDAICHLIREGLTLEKICKFRNMPPLHSIYAWKKAHPDFAKNMKAARKDRASYHHDKAIDILEDNDKIEKEDVPGLKFQFDSYMKLAERGSPDEYAAQPKQLAVQTPATIIINTGINREPVTIEGEVHGQRSKITTDDSETEDGERRERKADFASGIRKAEQDARRLERESEEARAEEDSTEGIETSYKEESKEESEQEK